MFVAPLLLSLSSASSLALAGNVLTVGSGGTFQDIQSAVTAAADGDVILVDSGTYSGFAIDGKSVSVVADTNATVDVTSAVQVLNLAAGDKAVIAGLRVVSLSPAENACFLAEENAGSVRLQSCDLGRADMHHGKGAELLYSDDVAMVGCTLRGSDGDSTNPVTGDAGDHALAASRSRVALYRCTIVGGSGEDGAPGLGIQGGRGADGCRLEGGVFFFVSATSIRGGDGGAGSIASSCAESRAADGGDGGPGAALFGQVYAARSDSTFEGGVGGAGGTDTCGPGGSSGADAFQLSTFGTGMVVAVYGGPAWELEMPTPVRESTSIPVTLRGWPGDTAYLTMWGDTRFQNYPFSGVLLERAPLIRRVRMGVIPPSGELTASIALPDLGPGVEGKTYFFQAYFQNNYSGHFVTSMGGPAFVVVLDSAF
jgi:hypothetical protein